MIIRKGILTSIRNYKKYKKSILSKQQKRNKLHYNIRRSYGRNNQGVITVRHKASGKKRLYREINFRRDTYDIYGIVKSIEYDPNRNSFISLIEYTLNNNIKKLEYNIHIDGLKINDKVISSRDKVEILPGNATLLKNIPQGSIISCIAIRPNERAKLARSAGTYATIMEQFEKDTLIKMSKSGFLLKLKNTCMATIGAVSNAQFKNKMLYKAGQKIKMGIRPTVRGVAMNPVDHPHGGGEGRGTVKRHPVSYTCKLSKGGKTASSRSLKNKRIIGRRINKKK